MGVLSYLAIGSNLGDRVANVRTAIARLSATAGLRELRTSSLWESEPWGVTEQPPFVNAVVEVRSMLEPPLLLEAAHELERELGRRREEETVRWGPRVLDVDLLFYGATVLREPAVELPHPRLHQRRFVLEPLCELNPALVHPTLKLTAAELLARCEDRGAVHRLAEVP